MRVIKCLVKSMYAELDAAHNYHSKAIEFKLDYPQIAMNYNEIAMQELGHLDKFHSAAVSAINKYKDGGKEIPEAMKAVWDFEHEKIMEEYEELKYKISKFTL